jgi:hypothetical protein
VISRLRMFTLGLAALSVSSCTGQGQKMEQNLELPDFALSCVAVLPPVRAVDADRVLSHTEELELEEGLQALEGALKKYFAGHAKARLLTSDQDLGAQAPALERARDAAQRSSCNAVLETSIQRYKDRIGGEYTAKEPASVAFKYRLIALPEEQILCRGRVDHQQQSLMENLFQLSAGIENSLTWVSADRLLYQGLRDRLNQCSSLVQ